MDKILTVLFDEADVEKHKANVEVVKGGVKDDEAIAELLAGVEVVLSFLGMVEPPKWIVNPGVEKLIEGLKKVTESRRTINKGMVFTHFFQTEAWHPS